MGKISGLRVDFCYYSNYANIDTDVPYFAEDIK